MKMLLDLMTILPAADGVNADTKAFRELLLLVKTRFDPTFTNLPRRQQSCSLAKREVDLLGGFLVQRNGATVGALRYRQLRNAHLVLLTVMVDLNVIRH